MDNLDRNSLTWHTVSRWLDERRQRCVESLVNGSPNDDKLRGEIRVIDDLIRDSEPPGDAPPPPDTDY